MRMLQTPAGRPLAACMWLLLLAVQEPGAAQTTGPSSPGKTPRNIVLISVDTLRADALGFAGNRQVATPMLDRLAAGGRVFERAHAHSVVTLPSHANMLTGRLPFEHGVRDNAGFALGTDIPTLATLLDEAGFATGAFIGAFPLDHRFGLARGFDVYDDRYEVGKKDQIFTFSERPGKAVVDAAMAWWHDHPGERKLLFLHLFDPHAPYQPPEPFATRFADNPYLGEVSAVDTYLTPLLDELLGDEGESSLVIFTSDHGEGLGDHGEDTHGLFAYESTLRVPLVLWGEGVAPGRDRRLAGHVDLLPTVLDALDMPHPTALPGRSLLGIVGTEAEGSGVDQGLYFEALSTALSFGWAPLRGMIVGHNKLIDLPLPELYNLQQDPGETANLMATERRTARAIANTLPTAAAWPPRQRSSIDAEEAARLQSLGYAAGSAPIKKRYTAADDPKNLVALDRKIRAVGALYYQDRPDDAIVLLRAIIRERPTMPLVYRQLADLLLRTQRASEAAEVMLAAREHGLADPSLLRELTLTLTQLGRASEALPILTSLIAAEREVESLTTLALALGSLGRHDEAVATLEEVLAASPDHARAQETMAFLAVGQGRFEAAAEHARKATEIEPERADAWNNLGVALYNLKRPAEAAHAWQRALELQPSNLDPLFNLAVAAAEAGNASAARRAFQHFLEIASGSRYGAQRQTAEQFLHQLDG